PKRELGSQIAVYINKAHPFFATLYARFLSPEADRQAKEAVDVLLIALARAELIVDDEQAEIFYQAQREPAWSPFLNDALRILAKIMRPEDEEAAERENEGGGSGDTDDDADGSLRAAE